MSVVRSALRSEHLHARSVFAKALGYASSASAHATWTGRAPLIAEELIDIERKLGVPREKVRPDLFKGYRRVLERVLWRKPPDDLGWAMVIEAAGGHGIAFKVLGPRLGITVSAMRERRYLEVEWLNQVEHLLGVSRHVLRPDLYAGFVRVIPPRSRLPEITEEIEALRQEALERAA